MNPTVILQAIELFAKESPEIMAALKRLFTKSDPTPQDWQAERQVIEDMNYDKLVPAGSHLVFATTT